MRSTLEKVSEQYLQRSFVLSWTPWLTLSGVLSLLAIALHLHAALAMLSGPQPWSQAEPQYPAGLLLALGGGYPLLSLGYWLCNPRAPLRRPSLWVCGCLSYAWALIHGGWLRYVAADPHGSRRIVYEWFITQLGVPWLVALYLAAALVLSVYVALVVALAGERCHGAARFFRYLGVSAAVVFFTVQWNLAAYFAAGSSLWSFSAASRSTLVRDPSRVVHPRTASRASPGMGGPAGTCSGGGKGRGLFPMWMSLGSGTDVEPTVLIPTLVADRAAAAPGPHGLPQYAFTTGAQRRLQP